MRSGAAPICSGCFHEAAFYNSDDEFLAIVVPFLIEGVQAREPTIVTMGEKATGLIRGALDDVSAITFHDGCYRRPASAIRTYRELLSAYVDHGARQIRVVGEVPHPGTGQPWEWWARYEAAINHALGEFPVWGLCPYDTRLAPADVLADVARTHQYLATTDGHHLTNTRFEDPVDFLTSRPATAADPLESTAPVIDVTGSKPLDARRAIRAASPAIHLDETEMACFAYAVNEAVTNAICHGRPPVRLRLWSGPHRMVAAISDRGRGPADPFAGLLPPSGTSGTGMGLWLIHQMCSHVTLGSDDDGFTIHLVTGSPGLIPRGARFGSE